MKKILINNKEFKFTKDNFPMLIHGKDHEGASFYTISLIANLYSQGFKVIVLCGYPMAFEQFKEQIGNLDERVVFYTKDKILDFKNTLINSNNIDEQIVLLKNVELFNEDIINFVLERNKYIISGDFNKCVFGNKILEKHFMTKIFFSEVFKIKIPLLNKYEGFLTSDKIEGITKIEL
jgi:hypothetical protein